MLDLSSLHSINDAFDDSYSWRVITHTIQAISGGQIDLSGVDTIVGPYRNEDVLKITSGSGGTIDLTGLLRTSDNVQIGTVEDATAATFSEATGPAPPKTPPADPTQTSPSETFDVQPASDPPSAGTVYWVAAGSGAWSNPNNWSTGRIPIQFEDVVIDVPGGEQTITISGDYVVRSLQSSESLVVTSGSLTVKADSYVDGTLQLEENTALTVTGSGVDFTANSHTWIDGATLNALQGSSLHLPLVTSFENGVLTIEGGVLTTPNLTNIDNTRFNLSEGASASIHATSYSATDMPSNQTLFSVDGVGTTLELLTLTTLDDSWYISSSLTAATSHRIQATNGGRINLSALQTVIAPSRDVDQLRFVIHSGGQIDLQTLTSIDSTGGMTWFEVEGERYALPSLRSVYNTSFDFGYGATLELASLESWDGGELIVPDAGAYELPVLRDATRLNIRFIGDGQLTANSLDSLTFSRLSLHGNQAFTAPLLGNIDNSRFTLRAGAQLTLPATSYSAVDLPTSQTLFDVDGHGTLLDLPQLRTLNDGWTISSSYTDPQQHVIRATTGGEIRFASLETIAAPGRSGDRLHWALNSGGVVQLPALTTVTSAGGETRFDVTSLAFSLPKVETIENTVFLMTPAATLELLQLKSWNGGSVHVPAAGIYRLPALQNASNLDVTFAGGGTIEAPNLHGFTRSTLDIAGGDVFDAPQLSNIDNSRFRLRAGAELTVPVTSYSARDLSSAQTLFRAEGDGTVLSFPQLASIDDQWWIHSTYDAAAQHIVEVSAGGNIRFSALDSISAPVRSKDQLRFVSHSGGQIELPELDTITSAGGQTWFDVGGLDLSLPKLNTVSNMHLDVLPGVKVDFAALSTWTNGSVTLPLGAALHAPQLTDASGLTLIASRGAGVELPQLVKFTRGTVILEGDHDLAWSHVTDIDDTRFLLRDNARLAVPATSYTATIGGTQHSLFLVEGTGSRLDLSALKHFSDGTTDGYAQNIQATDGGQIDLSGLEWISAPHSVNDHLRIITRTSGSLNLDALEKTKSPGGQIVFDTTEASLTLPALTTAEGTSFELPPGVTLSLPLLTAWHDADIHVPTDGEFAMPEVRRMTGTNIRLDQGATLRVPNMQSLTDGSLQFGAGQTLVAPALSVIDNSTLAISGGSQLALPVVRYEFTKSSQDVTPFSVVGQNSLLDLSSLRVIDTSGSAYSDLSIRAAAGGTINFGALETLSGPKTTTSRLDVVVGSTGEVLLPRLSAIVSAGAPVFFITDAAETTLPELDTVTDTTFQLRTDAQLNLPQLSPLAGWRYRGSRWRTVHAADAAECRRCRDDTGRRQQALRAATGVLHRQPVGTGSQPDPGDPDNVLHRRFAVRAPRWCFTFPGCHQLPRRFVCRRRRRVLRAGPLHAAGPFRTGVARFERSKRADDRHQSHFQRAARLVKPPDSAAVQRLRQTAAVAGQPGKQSGLVVDQQRSECVWQTELRQSRDTSLRFRRRIG